MAVRFEFLKKSEIREMSLECDKAGGINLSQGICDFPLEKVLRDSVIEAVDMGFNHYTRHDGEYMLRKAVSEKAAKYNKIQCCPEKNVIVTCGATGALFCVAAALFSPGDEILLFEPFYGYHVYTFLSLGIKPSYVRLEPPLWELDENEIEKKITNKTKAVLINTPLNPAGKVFDAEELKMIAALCEKYSLTVLTDEIYEYILYDGREHVSPASMKEFGDRVVTISGFSKTFSITGWRIGYCICPEKYAAAIGHLADLLYVCAPAPLQYAVAKAVELLDWSFYEKLKTKFTVKRSMICEALSHAGLNPVVPQGAYYVMADISRIPGRTGRDRTMEILRRTGVAAVPGEAFYHNKEDGYGIARFCFAQNDNVLKQACDVLKKL